MVDMKTRYVTRFLTEHRPCTADGTEGITKRSDSSNAIALQRRRSCYSLAVRSIIGHPDSRSVTQDRPPVPVAVA